MKNYAQIHEATAILVRLVGTISTPIQCWLFGHSLGCGSLRTNNVMRVVKGGYRSCFTKKKSSVSRPIKKAFHVSCFVQFTAYRLPQFSVCHAFVRVSSSGMGMLVKNVKCPLGKTHHISDGSRKLRKRGLSVSRRELLGGPGGMFPREILKSRPPKTAISCIFRPLSRCNKGSEYITNIQLSKENLTFRYCKFGAASNGSVFWNGGFTRAKRAKAS